MGGRLDKWREYLEEYGSIKFSISKHSYIRHVSRNFFILFHTSHRIVFISLTPSFFLSLWLQTEIRLYAASLAIFFPYQAEWPWKFICLKRPFDESCDLENISSCISSQNQLMLPPYARTKQRWLRDTNSLMGVDQLNKKLLFQDQGSQYEFFEINKWK
jgi:hypothetical protein